MKTSLGEGEWIATLYVELDPGDFEIRERCAFQVNINLRALAPLYRKARRNLGIQAKLGKGAIVVTQREVPK